MEFNKKKIYLFYLVAFFFILLLLSPLLTVFMFPSLPSSLEYMKQLFPFALSLALFSLIYLKVEKKSLLSLYCMEKKFDYPKAIAVFLSLTVFYTLFAILGKKDIVLNDAGVSVILLSATITLLMMPLQVAAEELLFRVLPYNVVSEGGKIQDKRNAVVAILFSGLLFLVMHLSNPELESFGPIALLIYFISGCAMMFFSVYEEGFESALSYHLANNLFLAIGINYSEERSVLLSSPIFINNGNVNGLYMVIELAGSLLLTLLVIISFKKIRKRS